MTTSLTADVTALLAQLDRADDWLGFSRSLPSGLDVVAAHKAVAGVRREIEALDLTDVATVRTRLAEGRTAVEGALGMTLDDTNDDERS